MLAWNLKNLGVSQESPNSSCGFAGLHFFEVEKLGKSSAMVQFLNRIMEFLKNRLILPENLRGFSEVEKLGKSSALVQFPKRIL